MYSALNDKLSSADFLFSDKLFLILSISKIISLSKTELNFTLLYLLTAQSIKPNH